MAKLHYYTGLGVFNFDGKDYGFGALLPAAVPEESIAAMLKKGKVSTTMPDKGGAVAVVVDPQIAVLKDKLAEATGAAERNCEEILRLQGVLDGRNSDLAAMTGERDSAQSQAADLAAKLEQANTTIEELTKQITTAVPSGAGPKK